MRKNTKVLQIVIIMISNLFIGSYTYAQGQISKPTIAVLSIETEGILENSKMITDMCRTELYKVESHTVMDKYDVIQIIDNADTQIDLNSCYGSICLSKLGKVLNVGKMLTGSIIQHPNKIIVRMRLIDVHSQTVEKDEVIDFLLLEKQLEKMIKISIQKLFDIPIDQELLTSLTKENNFENTINTPRTKQLNLSGPRAGIIAFVGKESEIMQASETVGGFDSRPIMFQFGYQFEISYLNSGNVQALFEIIPTITGVDQGRFIPSLTLLNGIRHNKNGFEFAFGPIILASKKASGFYIDGEWHLIEDAIDYIEHKPIKKERLDSRGDITIDGGLVIAIGKTFKSGNLNLPINFFTIIKKKEFQFGISAGYNASK